jgi:prepilin-type processing-associated H-X9-DG protein
MRLVATKAGVAVVILLLLAWHGGLIGDMLGGLAFGWSAYPARVLPRVTVNWAGVATGLVCLALFTIGLHRTLGWFYGEIQRASGLEVGGRRPWSARWTASLASLVIVMFLVGISATAVVHEAGWLIASRRSLVERKIEYRDDRGSSVTHLREIGMASDMLFMGSGPPPSDQPDSERAAHHSWMTEILPGTHFVVGGRLRKDLPWNDPRNSAYFKGVVPIYLNPQVGVIRNPEGYALGHYAGNIHVLGRDRGVRRVGPGGASNTILAGEVAEGFKPWGDPTNLRDPGLGINKVPGGFGGPSGSGANFLFLDGSVRFLRDTTSPEVLRRLSRPGSTER